MKTIYHLILILTLSATIQAQQVTPILMRIDIERKDDGIQYSLNNFSTTEPKEFSSFIESSLKKINTSLANSDSRLTLEVRIKGHVELSALNQLKAMLSPHGFDQFTVLPSYRYPHEVYIISTKGKPNDFELRLSQSLRGDPIGLSRNQTIHHASSFNLPPTIPRTENEDGFWLLWERTGSVWSLVRRLPRQAGLEARIKHPEKHTLLLNDKYILNGDFRLRSEISTHVGAVTAGVFSFQNGKWSQCTINIPPAENKSELLIFRSRNKLSFKLNGKPIKPRNLEKFEQNGSALFFGIAAGIKKDNTIHSLAVEM